MTSHYDAGYHFDKMEMPEAAYAMVSRSRARKMQPYIGRADKVFEFGVGSGLNLASLTCAVRRGFDVNPSSMEVAIRSRIEIVDSLDTSGGAYDVVICHHVLEHLLAPAECLVNLRRLLRPGGTLLLFVPYEEQRRYRKHIASDRNYHFYSWTPHTLANLVIECGFKVQSAKLGIFGYDRFCARLAAKLHLGDIGFRFLRWCAHLVRREREVRIVATCPAPL
jgi:SAM-dependent methyltransferase